MGGFLGHAFLEIALKHSHDAFYVFGGFHISPSRYDRFIILSGLVGFAAHVSARGFVLSFRVSAVLRVSCGIARHVLALWRSHFALVVVKVLLQVLERVKEGFLGLGKRILGFLVRFLVGNFPFGFLGEILVELRIRHLIRIRRQLVIWLFFLS